MEILSTRMFVTESPGARAFASRDVYVDEHGRPLAMRGYASDAERVRASVRVAVMQGRIPTERAAHFLDMGATDPEGTIETLLSMRPRVADPEELYRVYAGLTGVVPYSLRR